MDISRNTTSRQPAQHPRRPPAHRSVSLRRNQDTSRNSAAAPASDQANPPSSISPKLTAHKRSSGESSDAGNWFDKTNEDAVQNNASFIDNDPPFFLRNSSSSETPPEGHEVRPIQKLPHSTVMVHRPSMQRRGTGGSSAQDFRGVIDDLTVANKKLKQKLRKYEKLHDAHLQDEKLFEVRFHGLPDDKKRELEEYLRKFAAELESTDTGHPPVPYVPPLVPQKSTHSHASRVAESGYASMSASGQNSSSAPHNQESNRRPMTKSQYNQQQQNVRSYLHDIPAGLLPKRNAPMTERSKKKLVVRRLEQIFAGKRSAPGSHPQQMQQEEVAQSAARADRRAQEATGQQSKVEGQREARIMDPELEDNTNLLFVLPGPPPKPPSTLQTNEQDYGSGSPDQRPTRPLDLDPYRAQVPAENIRYIKHLGFTPPDVTSEEAPPEGHGWLYLNLLINMAQLHTINVTPDFVKEAVSEFSTKFELSHDGRKIRWRGDQRAVPANSDSSSELSTPPYRDLHDASSTSPAKRPKSGLGEESNESIVEIERQARRAGHAAKRKEQGKFAYEPLFFHKDHSDDDDYYNLNETSSYNSPFRTKPRGDSSGFTSSGIQSSSSRKRHDDGPMIFYNKANFCTDLSGDRQDSSVGHPATYETLGTQPLGAIPYNQSPTQQFNTGISEPRGPLDNATMDVDLKEGEKTSSSEEEVRFHPTSLRGDTASDESADIMDFEASGLGGVQPDDNFAIKVRRSRIQTASSTLQQSYQRKPPRYTKKIFDILHEQPVLERKHTRKQPKVIREEILSSSRKSLPSSALPPASFLSFSSPSECDEDSGSESDVSSSPSLHSADADDQPEPINDLHLLNLAAPTSMDPIYSVATGNEASSPSENSSEKNFEDDSIIDFLATARTLDPQTVIASEREYDAAVTNRLAEDILAGSSAATAGGGSGFNSPEGMEIIKEDVESPTSNTNNVGSSNTGTWERRSGSLKRNRTSDNITGSQKQKWQKK